MSVCVCLYPKFVCLSVSVCLHLSDIGQFTVIILVTLRIKPIVMIGITDRKLAGYKGCICHHKIQFSQENMIVSSLVTRAVLHPLRGKLKFI